MNTQVIEALEKQAAHEFAASQAYLAMSCWCEVEHYSGYAAFFRQQSAEETSHANKILSFLVERDVVPAIAEIPAPAVSFENLLATAKLAYELERANTAGIHACYKAALSAEDFATQVMLHWFISEQVEEEAWSDKMLAKTKQATCAGALTYLDHHIVKELTGSAS